MSGDGQLNNVHSQESRSASQAHKKGSDFKEQAVQNAPAQILGHLVTNTEFSDISSGNVLTFLQFCTAT